MHFFLKGPFNDFEQKNMMAIITEFLPLFATVKI